MVRNANQREVTVYALEMHQDSNRFPLRSKARTIDLSQEGSHLDLYLKFPFFPDVLDWLAGMRPYANIRHGFEAKEFRKEILPSCLRRLKREKLVQFTSVGRLISVDRVSLQNAPSDAYSVCDRISQETDLLLLRAFNCTHQPRFQLVRTRATPEKVREWTMRLDALFEEMDRNDEPHGDDLTIQLATL